MGWTLAHARPAEELPQQTNINDPAMWTRQRLSVLNLIETSGWLDDGLSGPAHPKIQTTDNSITVEPQFYRPGKSRATSNRKIQL
jgi:hypothetical protein